MTQTFLAGSKLIFYFRAVAQFWIKTPDQPHFLGAGLVCGAVSVPGNCTLDPSEPTKPAASLPCTQQCSCRHRSEPVLRMWAVHILGELVSRSGPATGKTFQTCVRLLSSGSFCIQLLGNLDTAIISHLNRITLELSFFFFPPPY